MKKYKPVTPSRRHMLVQEKLEITTDKPYKALLAKHTNKAGRNCNGIITVRHRGGGVKRKYRLIDFVGQGQRKGVIETVEYDPNRSAFVSLVKWSQGQRTYIIHCQGLKVGDVIESGSGIEIRTGNRLTLEEMPTGIKIHNIELNINKGGQLVRSAGVYATLMAKSEQYATIKLPSGEMRLINVKCKATVGEVGNSEHGNQKLGKAGKKRYLGFRPTVRGSVMNACDHPHGGGEGKAPIGHPSPLSPTGKKTMGYKTRDKKNKTSKYIVTRRK